MSLLDRLRNNLSLKLISLGIALLIWGAVHNQADPLISRQQIVPTDVSSVPEELAVAEIVPSQIAVTLYGRRSALERLQYSDFRLVADLKGTDIGTQTVPVNPEGLPAGIEIRRLSNRAVKVTLDAVVDSSRPVFVQTRGEPAQGFMVTGSQVRPTEVSVTGPSIEVRKVARVLAAVDVSGLSQTTPFTVNLMALDAGSLMVSGVKLEPTQAVVTVQMRQVNSRTVPVTPIIGRLPEGYQVTSVSARPIVVTITGQRLNNIEALQTEPLDLTSEPGRTQYNVGLQVPQGITVLGAPSVRVTVSLQRVEREPASSSPSRTPQPERTRSVQPEPQPEDQPEPPTMPTPAKQRDAAKGDAAREGRD